jgi:selenocysteine-specific elongation factor
MQVIATAGHVDHGKSALVRALTGMEPDRWAEERRRGMTIDLGFAWTMLPSGDHVAFVDVPGHERFVTNMLAGVGPAPAVCLVVAADEGWQPQTEEHVRALDALGVARGVVVVTKTDVADPDAVLDDTARRLATTSLRDVPRLAVSAHTGAGMTALLAELDGLVAAMPTAVADGPVRLWIDRAFTIDGAGTVVTGTLPAGSIAIGDTLTLAGSTQPVEVAVRGLHTQGQPRDRVIAVDRVAVNLRGIARAEVARGMALVTPGAWSSTAEIDVLVDGGLAADVVAHVGSAAVAARLRPLADRAARVRLGHALPIHVGDRMLLRDPGSRRVVGATVLDVAPAPLRRRGDAARVAATLAWPRSVDDEIARHGIVGRAVLVAAGFVDEPYDATAAGDLLLSPEWLRRHAALVESVVADAGPRGIGAAHLCAQTGIPAEAMTSVIEAANGVELNDGRVTPTTAADDGPTPAMRQFLDRLDREPWSGPDPSAVDPAELSAAVRAGAALRLRPGLYLPPDAAARAVDVLVKLPPPFTVSAARDALGATRRVVVPLLEHLDATRRTRRDGDGNRVVTRTEA